MFRILLSMLVVLAATSMSGCARIHELMTKTPSATAAVLPTRDSTVRGDIRLVQRDGGQVLVTGSISGLAPGPHGFHIHEKGNCSAPDAVSAGGHFNPGGTPHGAVDGAPRHGGDLGNIVAGPDGVARVDVLVSGISLGTAADSVVGRSVIVHAKADDFATQPSGNAGSRMACGLISRSE